MLEIPIVFRDISMTRRRTQVAASLRPGDHDRHRGNCAYTIHRLYSAAEDRQSFMLLYVNCFYCRAVNILPLTAGTDISMSLKTLVMTIEGI